MIKKFTDSYAGANTYLVWESESREAFVLDPCCRPDAVRAFAEENGITVKYLILSHGHYDHVCALDAYLPLFPGVPLLCHAEEVRVLTDIDANVSALFGHPRTFPTPDTTLADGQTVVLGDSDTAAVWRVLHTPGHTPGCICLYNEAGKTMLTGDTLFADGGFGRYDFKYGDVQMLGRSLRRLLSMDGEIMIYPGHGRSSTIRAEQNTQLYFQSL